MQIDRMDISEKLAAYDDAFTERGRAKEAEIELAEVPIRDEYDQMRQRHHDECREMAKRQDEENKALRARIRDAIAEIEARYDAMPEIECDAVDAEPLDWGDATTGMARCAKSGVVLLEDPETGEQYLRAALGLPPRCGAGDTAGADPAVSAGASA